MYKAITDKAAREDLLSKHEEEKKRHIIKPFERELNMHQYYDGEEHPDPTYLSSYLVNHILGLWKSHAGKIKGNLFGETSDPLCQDLQEHLRNDLEFKRFTKTVLQLQKVYS
jgi:hypothetical protein